MASKQPKVHTKPKTKMQISGPSSFEHLKHIEPGTVDDYINSEEGGRRPKSAPGSSTASPEYANGNGQLLITQEELKHLIRSEVAYVLKQEFEPIKNFLDSLEGDRSDALVDQQLPKPPDVTRRTYSPIHCEEQADVPETSDYDNVPFSRQSSVTSETSLKKPMPAPRPNLTAQHATAAQKTALKKRSLSNPTYVTFEDDRIIPAQEKNKKENVIHSSVLSDTSVKKLPVPQPRPNTLPKGRSTQISRTPSAPLYKKVHKSNLADERECLAAALQSNIQDIVDNLIFTESELPDELQADSCITDEENSEIIKLPNKRDQIRVLISLIKGRDLSVLQNFLTRIEKTNQTVADKVKATLEDNKGTLVTRCLCAYCELKTNVNIKYVVDGLWGMRAISDGLFTEIARCISSTGDQCVLWMRLMDSLNSIPSKELKTSAYKQLVHTLTTKNHYRYIAVKIEALISRHGHLGCKCKVQFCPHSTGSFTGGSSYTPWSSVSDVRFSHDKLSDTDKLSDLEGVDGVIRGAKADAEDCEKSETQTGQEKKETRGQNGSSKEPPAVRISPCPERGLVRQNAVDE